MNNAGILYREVQRFRQPWVWAMVVGASAVSIYGMVQQLILGIPFGNNPAPDIVVIIIGFAIGFGLPVIFYTMNLTTEVRPDGLYLRFFPLHLSFHRIEFNDVIGYEVKTYSAIREFGGWGIRYGLTGKAYNVGGNRGLQLELLNGENLLIGSQHPEELADVLCPFTRKRKKKS